MPCSVAMNHIDLPDKITVRLDTTDKLNLMTALREGLVPGYNPTTADVFRMALRQLVPPTALGTKPHPARRRK